MNSNAAILFTTISVEPLTVSIVGISERGGGVVVVMVSVGSGTGARVAVAGLTVVFTTTGRLVCDEDIEPSWLDT